MRDIKYKQAALAALEVPASQKRTKKLSSKEAYQSKVKTRVMKRRDKDSKTNSEDEVREDPETLLQQAREVEQVYAHRNDVAFDSFASSIQNDATIDSKVKRGKMEVSVDEHSGLTSEDLLVPGQSKKLTESQLANMTTI